MRRRRLRTLLRRIFGGHPAAAHHPAPRPRTWRQLALFPALLDQPALFDWDYDTAAPTLGVDPTREK